MSIEIKNRYTGEVIYSGDGETIRQVVESAVAADANLTGANLAGANLTRAYLAGANLADANLAGANLARANLAGANLAGANLTRAKWSESISLTMPPIQIGGLRYYVNCINGTHMQIGCKIYTLEEWAAFDYSQIAAMDGTAAVDFWRQWRELLLAVARGMNGQAASRENGRVAP